MAHARKTIRDAIVTTVTSLATTGANVFNNRITKIQGSELPCLLVYGDSEEIKHMSMSGAITYEREYQIIIEGVAKATSALQDTLDTIGKEVEVALNGTLPGSCTELTFDSVKFSIGQEGEVPIGTIQMMYNVIYQTTNIDPETIR